MGLRLQGIVIDRGESKGKGERSVMACWFSWRFAVFELCCLHRVWSWVPCLLVVNLLVSGVVVARLWRFGCHWGRGLLTP